MWFEPTISPSSPPKSIHNILFPSSEDERNRSKGKCHCDLGPFRDTPLPVVPFSNNVKPFS